MQKPRHTKKIDKLRVQTGPRFYEVDILGVRRQRRDPITSFCAELPNGVVVQDKDLEALRKKAKEAARTMKDAKEERFLIVDRGAETRRWYHEDRKEAIEFGYRVAIKVTQQDGAVYWKSRDDSRYHASEPDDDNEVALPWTKEGEDACKEILRQFKKIRKRVRSLLGPRNILKQLEHMNARLLIAGKEGAKS